jgi:hypothetical protein
MNKIALDIIYSTKVWLTSVLVSPFLLIFVIAIKDGFEGAANDAFGFIMMAVIFGFLFSIPCWIALMIAVRMVYNAEYEEKKFKSIINIIAVGIALIIFGFTFGGFYQVDGFSWAIPYIIVLTVGIWYFQLNPKEIQKPTTIDHLIE